MAFKYNSADASNAWPADDYDGEIASVEETKSKSSGADMLKLGVKVYNKAGQEKIITDYIVNPTGLFKLEQIARAFGKGAEFKANAFDVFTVREKRLTVSLGIQQSDEFGDKNTVKKYSAAKGGAPRPAPATAGSISRADAIAEDAGFRDKDIPF